MCRERRRRGFTLIELTIVVSIVALLAVVALPAYQGSVRRAHRAEAKAALSAAAQMMERYLTEHGAYWKSDTEKATLGSGGIYPDRSENNYYGLDLAVLTASTFTLTATPRNRQADDECGVFSLDQTGKRAVSGLTVKDCW